MPQARQFDPSKPYSRSPAFDPNAPYERATPATQRITVLNPDGQEGTIPIGQLRDAGNKGYRAVVYDKSGQRGSVPIDQLSEALQKGYKTNTGGVSGSWDEISPLSSEAIALEKNPIMRSTRYLLGEGQGLANAATGLLGGTAKLGYDALSSGLDYGNPLAKQRLGEDVVGAGRGIYRMGRDLFDPQTYADPRRFGEEVGNLAATAYAAQDLPQIGARLRDAAGDTRAQIGRSIRTPEGELKPMTRTASSVAGGLTGATLGGIGGHVLGLPDELGPLGGVYAGYKAGSRLAPSLLETVFPDPNAELRARGAFMNEGYKPATPRTVAEPPSSNPLGSIPSLGSSEFSRIGEGRAATWSTPDLYRIFRDPASTLSDRQSAIAQMRLRGLSLPPNAKYVGAGRLP